jgi:catechol 2,3-dioxygenase-like lactoylglutathione lyase family enzyme
MRAMRTKHVALHVPDLEHAEGYYRHVFELDVVTREALSGDDLADDETWAQLPHATTWEDARLAGIEIQMVGLRRGDLLLALFPGYPQPGTVFLIAVLATVEEIAAVRGRLPDDTAIEVDQDEALTFLDPFGFRWQLCGAGFIGPGDRHGRWLQVPSNADTAPASGRTGGTSTATSGREQSTHTGSASPCRSGS